MTYLLDANVLIALLVGDHVHHTPAERWLSSVSDAFATTPITQGALVRHLIRGGQRPEAAISVLESVAEDGRHVFWSDDISFIQVKIEGIVGHRQVTDAYLAQLSRAHDGRLATFDEALAALHQDVAQLIST